MRRLIKDFGDFINKGNVLTIAVGLVMALYFQKIVEAFMDGVINPIIAAIFGKQNFTDIGFDIGDARISIGLVIDAATSFVVVAFFLFLIVDAYNRTRPAKADVGAVTEVGCSPRSAISSRSASPDMASARAGPLEWAGCAGAAASLLIGLAAWRSGGVRGR